jgi:4-hydroxy-tetrahydrodipicolinate synthase
MVTSYRNGRIERALELHLRLYPLFRTLFVTTNPIPVKAALRLTGFDPGPCRPPLAEATPEEEEKLRTVMKPLGLL